MDDDLTIFCIDHVQSSPRVMSTLLNMDDILAPDSEEEDSDHPQRHALHGLNPSPHSSGSKKLDLSSWTTFSGPPSNVSSHSDNEITHSILTPEKHHRTEQVDDSTGASSQLVKSPHLIAKQASGTKARSSPKFIGVVIPMRRPLHSNSPNIGLTKRDTDIINRVVSSSNGKAEMDRKRDVTPGSSEDGVSDASAAPIPATKTLLSALTNTFERNKYINTHTARPSSGLADASLPPSTLVSKAKDTAASALTSKGTLKVLRPTQLRQADIDALLGTNVAPMRIDRKRGGEARFRMAHRRFQLDAGGGDGVGGEQADESGARYGRNEGDGGDGGRIRYTEPQPSRHAMFTERLEKMFGPGSRSSGAGAKPKKVCHLPRSTL